MQDIQQVFDEIQATKKELKELKEIYNDTLKNAAGYTEIKEQLDELKEKKKQIELGVQEEMGTSYAKIEDLKVEVANRAEMLTDLAINILMEGKTVEVKDDFSQYIPVYAVKFKKVK